MNTGTKVLPSRLVHSSWCVATVNRPLSPCVAPHLVEACHILYADNNCQEEMTSNRITAQRSAKGDQRLVTSCKCGRGPRTTHLLPPLSCAGTPFPKVVSESGSREVGGEWNSRDRRGNTCLRRTLLGLHRQAIRGGWSAHFQMELTEQHARSGKECIRGYWIWRKNAERQRWQER